MAIAINGSGTVTGISVGGLPDGIVDSGTLATNSVDSAELIDGAIDASHIAFGTGQVLQRIMTTALSSSTSINTWFDISGFNINITPTSTASRVLVFLSVNLSSDNTGEHLCARVMRDSTVIGGHTSLSSRGAGFTAHFTTQGVSNAAEYCGGTVLDHPNSTSAVNYKVQGYGGGEDFYMNRPETDTDNAHYQRGVSTLTLIEVIGNTQ